MYDCKHIHVHVISNDSHLDTCTHEAIKKVQVYGCIHACIISTTTQLNESTFCSLALKDE